ncbi:MAG: transcriptional regulator MntR, partial [Thalassospira sp.]|nr:transcriptional regulator MntR [Thalassospira sp.]
MGEDTQLNPRHNKAEVFARLRDAHAREVTEDYVEMIGDLIAEE